MNTEVANKENTELKERTTARRPYYTVSGDKKEYNVEVFMPGVAKDAYDVTLNHDELVIEGRKSVLVPEKAHVLHQEIPPEDYKLRLQLNVSVDEEKISAKSEDGILRITLPVAREAQPKRIKIE